MLDGQARKSLWIETHSRSMRESERRRSGS